MQIRIHSFGWAAALLFPLAAHAAVSGPEVVTVSLPSGETISPWIYGFNYSTPPAGLRLTQQRSGGNRLTGYNWENNYSNAGKDWYHNSDNYLVSSLPSADQTKPGQMLRLDWQRNHDAGRRNLVTLQLAGYVAADRSGSVTEEQTAPSARWAQVVYRKDAPYTLTPDTTDGVVYLDECINFLTTNFGTADAGGVWAYSLDNEPALWVSTHPRIHPTKPTIAEVIQINADAASMVKDMDSSALVFGPALYGWSAYQNFQDAADWSDYSGQYNWFVAAYLAEMKQASDADGRRLLDVVDLHYYPEAQGDGHRITEAGDNDVVTPGGIEARLQAPRSLWDPTYTETSWISQWITRGPLKLLPRVQESIDAHYPGTKISLTEYNFGASKHYSGGLAQADVLGILGRDGVFAANLWGTVESYFTAAFSLYRNYDGKGGVFGDQVMEVVNPDIAAYSIYAAAEAGGPPHIIAINKTAEPRTVQFELGYSGVGFDLGRVYGFGEGQEAVVRQPDALADSPNVFTYTLPAHFALHFVFEMMDEDLMVEVLDATSVRVISRVSPGQAYRLESSTNQQDWTPHTTFTASQSIWSADIALPTTEPLFFRIVRQ